MIHAAKLGQTDTVLEIGPGTGVLTRALAKNAGCVLAIEKDERMAEELKKSLNDGGFSNIEVMSEDILHFVPILDRYKVVANIPYYLTSRLLRLIFEEWPRPELIVLTIQKEVAQRIVARPPKMNLLALSVQIFGTPEIIKKVPAECFYPKPAIESAILKISYISDRILKEAGVSPKDFFTIAKTLFGKKRKTILNNLANLAGKEKAREILARSRINEQKRAEEFSVEEILLLTRAFSSCP